MHFWDENDSVIFDVKEDEICFDLKHACRTTFFRCRFALMNFRVFQPGMLPLGNDTFMRLYYFRALASPTKDVPLK